MNSSRRTIDWPLSNVFIAFAILLLVGTAIALSLQEEADANQLATYAYYSLAIGVALRLIELAFEDSSIAKWLQVNSLYRETVSRLPDREKLPDRTRLAPSVSFPRSNAETFDLETVLKYTLVGTAVSGVLALGYWRATYPLSIDVEFYVLFGATLTMLALLYMRAILRGPEERPPD